MDAPVCKLCGTKHWLGGAHVFTKAARKAHEGSHAMAAIERRAKEARKLRGRERAAKRAKGRA
jgi:hypothetical protein